MTEKEAFDGWDALWQELLSIGRTKSSIAAGHRCRSSTRDRKEVLTLLLQHAEAAFALYEGKTGPNRDDYRAAMWLRRIYLLQQGRTYHVYDGSDALAWRYKKEANPQKVRRGAGSARGRKRKGT